MKKTRFLLMILIVLIGLGAAGYDFLRLNFPSIERWVMSVPPRSQTPDEQKSLSSLEIVNDHPFYKRNNSK